MTERSVRQGDFLTAEEAIYHQNAFVFPVFLLKIDKLVFEESRQEAKLRGFMMESHSESGFHATFSTLHSTFRIYVQLLQNTFQFSKIRATFHFYAPLRIILICQRSTIPEMSKTLICLFLTVPILTDICFIPARNKSHSSQTQHFPQLCEYYLVRTMSLW